MADAGVIAFPVELCGENACTGIGTKNAQIEDIVNSIKNQVENND